jgi:hypothetical protein
MNAEYNASKHRDVGSVPSIENPWWMWRFQEQDGNIL